MNIQMIVQSVFTENGIVLSKENKKLLFSEKTGFSLLEKLDISEASGRKEVFIDHQLVEII